MVYINIFEIAFKKNGVQAKIREKIKLSENSNIIFVRPAQSGKVNLCCATKTKNFFCVKKQFVIDNCFFLPYNKKVILNSNFCCIKSYYEILFEESELH